MKKIGVGLVKCLGLCMFMGILLSSSISLFTVNAVDVITIDGIKYAYYYENCAPIAYVYSDTESTSADVEIISEFIVDGETFTVIKIDDYAFKDAQYLQSIVIPNSVLEIGRSSFENCVNLSNVDLSYQLVSLGYSAFENCVSLTQIKLHMDQDLTSIGYYCFYGCSSLEKIEIPNTVLEIGESAFSGCTSLTYIEIPNSITKLKGSVFKDCSNLTRVTIPYSVSTINKSTFDGCENLSTIDYTGMQWQWEKIDYSVDRDIKINYEGEDDSEEDENTSINMQTLVIGGIILFVAARIGKKTMR